MSGLIPFITESNRIEGIRRAPTDDEIAAHKKFLCVDRVTVNTMEKFVERIAPGAPLRDKVGRDVRIGNHLPPRGGPYIRQDLAILLAKIYSGVLTPFEAHTAYETLHPFIDGNGRSGRVLWAWHMESIGRNPFSLPFLHAFYYQALDASQGRQP